MYKEVISHKPGGTGGGDGSPVRCGGGSGHIETAKEIANSIMTMSPIHQNEVLKHISELVKKNRAGEIEHKTKELEELKNLYQEI